MAIYLLRHGKASHSGPEYDVLSERGAEQARRAAQALLDAGVRFDACLSGPLHRQADTFRHMVDAARLRGVEWPAGEEVEGLREAPLDDIARKWLPQRMWSDESLWKFMEPLQKLDDSLESNLALGPLFNDLLRRWRDGEVEGDYESYGSFVERVRAVAARLEREGGERNLLVVTSTGVIYALVTYFENGAEAEQVVGNERYANASITVLDRVDGRIKVVRSNDVAHLEEGGFVSYL